MTSVGDFLHDVIKKCGGFGRYQWILATFVYSNGISLTWAMLMMSFAAAEPDWWCVVESSPGNQTSYFQNCNPVNISHCASYRFDESMSTVINEWNLICDKSWVPATITTIQMVGVLLGSVICGQMGDSLGRKPTLFAAIFLLSATNLCAFFSVSWQMFATLRFFMGIACGVLLGVGYVLVHEFISSTARAVIMAIPAWAISSALLALVSWLIHDWKYLHLMTALTSGLPLFAWWIIPESFRWLVVHHRFDQAREIIRKMARVNGAPEPDLSNLETLEDIENSDKMYTYLDLFKGKFLLKNTIYLSLITMSCGYVFFAIAFGVKDLSGSLYLNMFLMSIVEIPTDLLTIILNNRIGRKWTALGFYIICAIGTLVVAVVQISDIGAIGHRLINGFAMLSVFSVASGWISISLLSIEIYPTAVRNLGISFLNTVTRLGTIISPQMVFVNDRYPGAMYFLAFAFMIVCVLCTFLTTETLGKELQDTIIKDKRKEPNQKYSEKVEVSMIEKEK